jgi:hypothetical protein
MIIGNFDIVWFTGQHQPIGDLIHIAHNCTTETNTPLVVDADAASIIAVLTVKLESLFDLQLIYSAADAGLQKL